MKIDNIKATRMELTQPIADYVVKRVDALEKFVHKDDSSVWATAEVGKTTHHHKQGNLFFAEINLHIAGKNFRAVAEKDDLYAAIDEARDEIMHEITSYKDKRRTMMRKGALAVKNLLKGIGDFGRGLGGRISSLRRPKK